MKAAFVTGKGGAGGVGNRVSNTLSDEKGNGMPLNSYLGKIKFSSWKIVS